MFRQTQLNTSLVYHPIIEFARGMTIDTKKTPAEAEVYRKGYAVKYFFASSISFLEISPVNTLSV